MYQRYEGHRWGKAGWKGEGGTYRQADRVEGGQKEVGRGTRGKSKAVREEGANDGKTAGMTDTRGE